MTDTHDKLREAVARALFDYDYAWTSRKQKPVLDKWWERWVDGPWFERADAALSLMQPEIDRRVAEERARLLEQLRIMEEALAITRSALIHRPYCASLQGDFHCNCGKAGVLKKVDNMLAQFEKENSDEQHNSKIKWQIDTLSTIQSEQGSKG